MHIASTSLDAQRTLGAALDRRSFVRGGAVLGMLALVAPLAGCSMLGIEDPAAESAQPVVADQPGTVDFEKLSIALNLDQTSWEWSQIDNDTSPINGSIVVGIPATATNNDDLSRVLSGLYCKVSAPDGTVQSDISVYYTANDILQKGSIAVGGSESGVLHILYRGAGAYTLAFDNLLGGKAELAVQVPSSSSTGLRPIPARVLSSTDAANAVPSGESFDVSGLTLTYSADEASYWWTQSWDETNEAWNGRWCVGVPLTVTNHTDAAIALTADMYGMFAPALYRLEDPAPWFADSSLAYLGSIAPGQSVQTAQFWVYIEDGMYYGVFDNDGDKTVASVRIAQYS